MPLTPSRAGADSGRSGRLKPYWGKPAVRNFRGLAGDRARWRTEAPPAERGGQQSDSPPKPRRLRATRHLHKTLDLGSLGYTIARLQRDGL